MPKWINPTGGPVRGTDSQGSGKFGAPRGNRKHLGTDYTGIPGQAVLAVTDGTIDKIGHCYGDDLTYRYFRLRTTEGHIVRHLYVRPTGQCGPSMKIKAGQELGTLQALHPRYPGIQNHVHVDIEFEGEMLDPETLIM